MSGAFALWQNSKVFRLVMNTVLLWFPLSGWNWSRSTPIGENKAELLETWSSNRLTRSPHWHWRGRFSREVSISIFKVIPHETKLQSENNSSWLLALQLTFSGYMSEALWYFIYLSSNICLDAAMYGTRTSLSPGAQHRHSDFYAWTNMCLLFYRKWGGS